MTVALVINSGSSSLKYQVLDMVTCGVLGQGLIERIGEETADIAHRVGDARYESRGPIADHIAAFAAMMAAFAEHGPDIEGRRPSVVGHRVVHGGRRFDGPAIVTDRVERDIEELEPLAPLHNPANLEGIRAARTAFPDLPHVAVFDTAFHASIPEAAATYAIDREVAARHRVRRYGFHGTSHAYVANQTAAFLGRPIDEIDTIVLHIGNGASACAVRGGRSIDTSMGMTPLEGLVMGTRSGDIDPAVLVHLHHHAGMSFDELDDFLNRRSGLLGLAGSSDLRDVLRAADRGDADARLAIDVYVHRIRRYLGAYLVGLGGADAIAFTAGVGENAAPIRRLVVADLEWLGIELDAERNASPARGTRVISTDASRTAVLVVPTNEELEIAQQSLETAGISANGQAETGTDTHRRG
ncbi:acetate kinase [Pseudoclavibacter endophyticus]|uniref:Acetate kinase n=1 Tax=Pseudoclavibacter endophyticus TaxID=1778590 RepID=A0A6H9WNB0_9MICO|nr:acetate kinase [Pseudoclavibacter endophyticus]KAB1648116.1 acetate kinase [Pseudoclavibacter endophyticus]GGA69867.1 acetate kinase [Pseudoclavibacter endophyticus]